MREVITIGIGSCGVNVANKFVKISLEEHQIDQTGTSIDTNNSNDESKGINVLFKETQMQRYYPRTILIDTDPQRIDQVKSGGLGQLYGPDNLISGSKSCQHIWAQGMYGHGTELTQTFEDVLRKETESCDAVQSIQFINSSNGGCGSGLGTLLQQNVSEQYASAITANFSVAPSKTVCESILEPYNFVLSKLDNSSINFLYGNETLHNICTQTQKIQSPTYGDYDNLIASTISDFSCCTRFPGQLNGDARKMTTMLLPFSSLNILSTSLAPIYSFESTKYVPATVSMLKDQLYGARSNLNFVNNHDGKYLSTLAVFRGSISSYEVEAMMQDVKSRQSEYFVSWLPNQNTPLLCSKSSPGHMLSATQYSNSTAISNLLLINLEKEKKLRRRKMFLHKYLQEGLDEMEMTEAESYWQDKISEYQQYDNMTEVPSDQEEDE